MFSFKNIYYAYKDCIKHKRNSLNAQNFEANLIENLWNLRDELKNRRYKIGKSICFLASSPKLREIFAADFRDRVVHHLLIREIEPFYEKKFIYDVYNNRKNKGIHKALKRAKKFAKRERMGYYLQLDIKGFFYSLDKNTLFKRLFLDISKSSLSYKKEILWLSNKIIYHDPTKNFYFKGDIKNLKKLPPHKTLFKVPKNRGLPIGNLTSQFFANVYMNTFDHFVKRELKVKSYLRYVDDFVLFDSSKDRLLEWKYHIENYLEKYLSLKLRDDFKLKKVKEGLDFLGYIIRDNYVLIRKRVVNNFKFKKAKFLQKYEDMRADVDSKEIERFLSVKASFIGHIKHANSFNLMKKVGVIDDEKYISSIICDSWHYQCRKF